jgi:hypothetical protein
VTNHSGVESGGKKRGYAGSAVAFGDFDKSSGINVPLLDYSEETFSNDGRNSK